MDGRRRRSPYILLGIGVTVLSVGLVLLPMYSG